MTTERSTTSTTSNMAHARAVPGGFRVGIKWRVIGSAAPVFPGFEVDICERVPDDQKPDAVWHRDRAKAMIRAHSEIKELFGHYPGTAFWCVVCAGAQVALAAVSVHLPWWGMLLIAYFVGSLINQQLFQLAHECDHHLVFKKPAWNRYLFTLTSLPMFLSGHHTWWVEHIVHHNDMGATKDFITRRRSFFLVTRYVSPLFLPFSLMMLVTQVFRSVFGLLVYAVTSLLRGRLEPTRYALAVLADEHLVSGYEREKITKWAVVYPLLSLIMYGALAGYGYVVAGWFGMVLPLVYLMLAQTFFTGWLHPYCLGWVLAISHFHGTKRYQPTASNYGWLINRYTFGGGLHVEHHDIMGIPWFRLAQLRKIAPEFYDDLDKIHSYTWLGLQFVFGDWAMFDAHFNGETYRNLKRFAEPGNGLTPR